MGKAILLLWLVLFSLSLIQLCNANQPFVIQAWPGNSPITEESGENDSLNSLLEASPLRKNLNQIVDVIIALAKDTITKDGHSTIKLPDIEEEFHKKIHHFIKIKGKFTAENGWFKDLSTIHRTGDATLSHSGANVTVSVSLGLGTMQVGYDHYRVKAEHISVSGKIEGEVKSNSITAKVNGVLLSGGKCNLTLQELKIDKFSDLKVKVSGLIKPLDWLLSKIATSVAKHMKDKYVHLAEEKLTEAAKKVLDKYHC